jgi:hypothetical protein
MTPISKPSQAITTDQIVVERDDGFFQIGVGDDAPGPFESRAFAEAVANDQALKNSTRHIGRLVLE